MTESPVKLSNVSELNWRPLMPLYTSPKKEKLLAWPT